MMERSVTKGLQAVVRQPDFGDQMLSIVVRHCSGEALSAREKKALEDWSSISADHAALLTVLSDPTKAGQLIGRVFAKAVSARAPFEKGQA